MTTTITPTESLLLATGGFLSGLDPHHIHKLAGLALEAQFDPGHVVFHEGDERNRLYLILSGSVLLKPETENTAVQILNAGDILGWSALLEGDHRHFEAVCKTEVRALAFEGEELLKVFDTDPRLGYAVMKRLLAVLAQRIEAARHAEQKAPQALLKRDRAVARSA